MAVAVPLIASLIAAFGPKLAESLFPREQTRQTGFANNFNPQRQQGLSQWLEGLQGSGLQNDAFSTLRQQMQPFDANQYEDFFNQGVANPANRNYQEQTLPAIQARFNQGGARHNSALNQAIGRSAENLNQGLGGLRSQYLNQARQQHMSSQAQSAANALGLFQNAYGGNDVTPLIQQGGANEGMEMLKAFLSQYGQHKASQYDPSKGFGQWFGDSSSPANPSGQRDFSTPFADPSIMGSQPQQPFNAYSGVKNYMDRGY